MSDKSITTEQEKTTITADDYQRWQEEGLISRDDIRNIAQLTRDAKMRRGQGYSNEQVRNVTTKGFTATAALVNVIQSYYQAKKEMNDRLAKIVTEEV